MGANRGHPAKSTVRGRPPRAAQGAEGSSGTPPAEATVPVDAREQWFRTLVDDLPDLVVRFDAELRRTYVNRSWELALGVTAEDAVGRKPGSRGPQPSDQEYLSALAKALETGIPQKVEFSRVNARGETLDLDCTIVPERDQAGRVVGLLAIGHDVTARQRAEEEIRALNRELERQVQQHLMLLDQASDAIFVTNENRRYIDVNIAACELLGYTREELLALSVAEVVPPDRNPGQDERFARMSAGERFLSERVLRRKDGSLLVAELNSRRLPDGRFQAIVRDVTARKEMEKEQRRLATAVEQADEAIVITDPSATILYVNPAFERVSGYARSELLGANPRVLRSGRHNAAFYRAMWTTLLAGQTWHGTFINRRKDGSLFEEEAWITPMRDSDGSVVSYVGVKRDVTRERILEEQLHQAQKMEAVGQLAGGIAHDFNNLITAIRGYSELVSTGLPPDSAERGDIDQIMLAADRAAELTRQLLAFSRRQVLKPQVVSPAAIVEGIVPMLRRLLREDVELVTTADPHAGCVRVDPNMLERVVVNLAVNARDAMPAGGRLTIGTSNADVEAGGAEGRDAGPIAGRYVVIEVADTGLGMDAATQARAFEPFFTTKDPASGTGMGLASVHGMVKQSGGEISLRSEPGLGTTFKIYLPRVDGQLAEEVARDQMPAPGGSETILLVEDEASVRAYARRSLEGLGYTVIEASNGREALARAAEGGDSIDLLLTDVVMPGMSGRKLAGELKAARPALRVLLMSGFAARESNGVEADPSLAVALDKPFTRQTLARAVRRAIEGRQ